MTNFDPKRLNEGQIRTIMAARHHHPDDLRIVDAATHEKGYLPAQAAGFALITKLESVMDLLDDMPKYVDDRGQITENGTWFDIEEDARALSMTTPAIHALRIVRAQGRDDDVSRMLEGGVVLLRLLDAVGPEAIRDEHDRRENERFEDMYEVLF